MHLRTIQASSIKSLVEVLHSILNDVNFIFSKGGIRVLTLDASKTALVNVFLEAEQFEEYTCEEGEVLAGLNMTNMYKLLKSVTNTDMLSIDITTTEKMTLTIENDTKKSKTIYSVKLLDLTEEILEDPSIEMSVVTTLPSLDFQRLCRDMSNLSKQVHIHREGKSMKISCEGDFADQMTDIQCADDTGEGKAVKDLFSLTYVTLFTKATSMCQSVQILQERDGMPVIFRYSVASLGSIEFFLAPISQS